MSKSVFCGDISDVKRYISAEQNFKFYRQILICQYFNISFVWFSMGSDRFVEGFYAILLKER